MKKGNEQDSNVLNMLSKEIEAYKQGKMQTNSLRFQLFVMCANKVTVMKQFYELSLQQINEYFQTVQVFTKDEIVKILHLLISQSDTENFANFAITKLLPSIRCPYEQAKNIYYLSPCCCEDLYQKFTKDKYKYRLKNNHSYSLGKLFNFKSVQMLKMRASQEEFIDPPRFKHYPDTPLLIVANKLNEIYGRVIKTDDDSYKFDKELTRPTMWEPNIHLATKNNDLNSIRYNIFLLPLLRNLPNENGDTPAHIAAMHSDVRTINKLYELKADMNKFNAKGDLPIHVANSSKIINALINCGCSLDSLNEKGQTLLEIKTNSYQLDINLIRFLLEKGVNIFQPYQNGVFWAQRFLYMHDLYRGLQTLLTETLVKSTFPYYKDNQLFQELIRTRNSISKISDEKKLREAVINRNMEQIITLVGIGAETDKKDENKLTNLMIVSSKNDFELVKLFASNYSDPNNVNKEGENSFWISASKEFYDISTLLYKKYNANPDILSNTGETLMHIAYSNHREELLYYLLDLGASPNIPSKKDGQTVLFRAFLRKDDKVAEIIQDEFNGDIKINDKLGNTLGHVAIIKKDKERLEYLFKRNLPIESKDNSGRSLFSFAISTQNDPTMWKFLLDHGSDINSKDNEGNTSFYLTCYEKSFNREKFDFLLKNNCNINIRNNKLDFPISQLINNERKNEALILLDQNADINDCESVSEPVVISLIKNDEIIFEKLVECGANALNKKYPVIERYLDEYFFNFETLKKMKDYNLTIGAPLQRAIHLRKNDVAVFLWEKANEVEKVQISKSLDRKKQTPLVASIVNKNEYFINLLIQKNYDLSTPDKHGKSPLIYLCSRKMKNWIEKIAPLLTPEQLSVTDNEKNSAMTFAAEDGDKDLCDKLFLLGINLTGINHDKNDMVQNYINILNRYNKILQRAAYIEKLRLELIDDTNKEISEIESSIRKMNIKYEIKKVNIPLKGEESFNLELDNIREEIDSLKKSKSDADQRLKRYVKDLEFAKKNLAYLKSVTRHDMLYNMKDLEQYAPMWNSGTNIY